MAFTARASGMAWQRFTSGLWPLAQQTVAGTLAWVIAKHVGGHADPFFAPIAAVAALNASLGERGTNAIRLILGVFLGIVTAELTLLTVGGGYVGLAVAMFVAMTIARVFVGAAMVVGQAAASAILTVAIAAGDAGIDRLTDALIGAGIALIFSQLLFAPEPLALLRRAETAALQSIAGGFALATEALESGETGDEAIATFRQSRDRLAELRRARHTSTTVAQRSLTWRRRTAPVVRATEDAGQLDLLGGSALMLARAAFGAEKSQQRLLVPAVRALAKSIAAVSDRPGDRTLRQQTVEDVLTIMASDNVSQLDAAISSALRMVAIDLAAFAGSDITGDI